MHYVATLVIFLLMSAAPPLPEPVAQPTGGWTYHRTVDRSGEVVYKASVRSSTRLDMGYPYGKGATITLTLRSRQDSPLVSLEVSKGYFNRSFQNGTALVRFDQAPARQYVLLAAANGRANIVFLDADRLFLQAIRRANRMIVDIQFAGYPNRQVVFPTIGLQWAR